MSEQIVISEVPDYVAGLNIRITRQTAYNWYKVGLKGEKLRTLEIPGGPRKTTMRVTTREWINEFIQRCGLRQRHS